MSFSTFDTSFQGGGGVGIVSGGGGVTDSVCFEDVNNKNRLVNLEEQMGL